MAAVTDILDFGSEHFAMFDLEILKFKTDF